MQTMEAYGGHRQYRATHMGNLVSIGLLIWET
jgi:hypothetical protein